MFSSGRQAVACILLLLSTAVCAQSQSAVDKTQNSSISGKVTFKGKGISGIAVGLQIRETMRSENTRLRAVTDDEGKYRIANVPPGSYDVIVSAVLYVATTTRQSLIVGKSEAVENVDFALTRGGVITGKVTDSEGRPLIEEEVQIVAANKDSANFSQSIRTDDRGIYRAFAIPPGKYTVYAGKEEYNSFGGPWDRAGYQRAFYSDGPDAAKPTAIEVSEGSEATNIDITLTRSLVKYSAYGRVVDGETGQPMPNVRYGAQMFVNENNSYSSTYGVVTNKDGEFRLDNLSPGKYAVYVEPPGDADWGAAAARFEVVDQDVEDLVVKTYKGGSASGVIVFEGGEIKTIQASLAKAQIYAHVSTQPGRRSNSATVKPDGSFQLRGLGGGLLQLWISLPERVQIVRIERDGVAYSRGVPIKEHEHITGLRIVLNRADGTIRGVVKLETGAPPAGAQFYVSLKRLGEDNSYSTYEGVQVDARGQFMASGLLPGTYELNAAIASGEVNSRTPRATQQVVVSNGSVTNVELTLQPQTVPGRP